ncbi:MAG TPA: hypothetical protein DCF70_07905 [Treponema sp.]|nr:hypothetical protein [Treponema sp.]
MKKHTLIISIFALCAAAAFAFGGGRGKGKGAEDRGPRGKGQDRPPRMEKELTTITGTVTVDSSVITITSSEVTTTELEVLTPPEVKDRPKDMPQPEEFNRDDQVEPPASEEAGDTDDDKNSKPNKKHRQKPPKPVTEKELSAYAGKNVELKGFYTPTGKFIVLQIVEK